MRPEWRAHAPTLLLALAMVLAFILRIGQGLLRWDEVALAYAAYQTPVVEVLTRPWEIPGVFVGLHPPLYGLFFALLESLAGIPALFLIFSLMCSMLTVVVIARAGARLAGTRGACAAALLVGVSPLAVHYAAEINNYPLLLLLVALLVERWTAWRQGQVAWWVMSLVGLLAVWTHLLGALAATLVTLLIVYRSPREGLRVLFFLLLGSLPVLIGASHLASDAHTFAQPDVDLPALHRDWTGRFGWFALASGALALPAMRSCPGLTILGLGLALGIGLLMLAGVAATHQFPYWSLLVPPFALLIAAGLARARSSWRWLLVLTLALMEFGYIGWFQARTLLGVERDLARERAVDLALAQASPGDAIGLISPALEPDDDKRASSSVLWRLPPWHRAPAARPFLFDGANYRFGQPRRFHDFFGQGREPEQVCAGLVSQDCYLDLFTWTDFWAVEMDAVFEHYTSRGRRVWLVLYDHAPADAYPQRLRRMLEPWVTTEMPVGEDRGLGQDLLTVVKGPVLRESSSP